MAPEKPEPRRISTRERVKATGLTDRKIDLRLASGELVAERRGVLRDPKAAEHRVPLRIEAALLANRTRDLVVSHTSAAEVLGLPKPLTGWGAATFTATSGATRRRDGVVVRVAPLGPDDVVRVEGRAVTAPSRTVVDCLRVLGARDGLAIADRAARLGLVTGESLLAVLSAQAGWPGIAAARRIAALTDGRRESPLESWTAWAFSRNGVPAPEWQMKIYDPAGAFIGRADCWWPIGVAGEADGRQKYTLATAQRGGGEQSALDVLHEERRREAALRNVGVEVVRWSSGEVLSPSRMKELARRIRGALTDAHNRPSFTGRAVPYSAHTP